MCPIPYLYRTILLTRTPFIMLMSVFVFCFKDSRSVLSYNIHSFIPSVNPLISMYPRMAIFDSKSSVSCLALLDGFGLKEAALAAAHIPIPYPNIFSTVRVVVLVSLQDKWSACSASSELGQFTRRVFHLEFYACCSLRQTSHTTLARLRIGHTRLSHGYLLFIDHHPYYL